MVSALILVVMVGLESTEVAFSAKLHAHNVFSMWLIALLVLASSMLMKANALKSALKILLSLIIIIWFVHVVLLLVKIALIRPQHVHRALLERIFITTNVYKHAQIQLIHRPKNAYLARLPAYPVRLLQYVYHAQHLSWCI